MKPFLLASATGVALLLCTECRLRAGTTQTSQAACTVSVGAGDEHNGYVEFSAKQPNAAFRVYKLDAEQQPHLLAVIGVKTGKKYRLLPNETGAPVAERLRVVTVPGSSKFMIERGGRYLTLTVAEDKVTPVIVDYELLEQCGDYDVCRIETEVSEPVPTSEQKPQAPEKDAKG
jgi:hypothetical protein